MSKTYAFYNENDAYAAQWLRNLIKAGHITDGVVDDRSIEDITPDDLKGFRRVHLFAGIGVWDYALNRAGWGDYEVWSGSCPCQPFSVAGKGLGFADERHLWPAMLWLVQQRRPITVFGEQVASKDGYTWLDTVSLDLENTGYTVGAVVAPAAGFGAPHQRHRMYWVAHSNDEGSQGREFGGDCTLERVTGSGSVVSGLADTLQSGRPARRAESGNGQITGSGIAGGLADTADFGQHGRRPSKASDGGTARVEPERLRDASFWSDAEWIYCRDEKYRPVEPGTFPLADWSSERMGRLRADQEVIKRPSRVGMLRAYGNAIVGPQAEEFIKAYLEVRP